MRAWLCERVRAYMRCVYVYIYMCVCVLGLSLEWVTSAQFRAGLLIGLTEFRV